LWFEEIPRIMLSSDEAELKLSPQSLCGDMAEDVNNSQSNPTSNLLSQSPTLPPRHDEKESNSSTFQAAQDEGQDTLGLLSQNLDDKGKVTLPPNDEDSEGIQTPEEMKCHEEKNDQKVNFSSDVCDDHLPRSAASLHFETKFLRRSKSAQELSGLSLEDDVDKRQRVASAITHRKTEPVLISKKRRDKNESIAMFFPPSQWSSRYGIQFFTVVIPKVTVVKDYENGPKGTYAVYQLEIKRGRQVIVRKYRYSQFSDFHQALLRSSIAIILQQAKIYLPAKTWFKKISPSFLEQRRMELEKYLHRLLQFKYSPREALVQKFLALNEFEVMDFWIDH